MLGKLLLYARFFFYGLAAGGVCAVVIGTHYTTMSELSFQFVARLSIYDGFSLMASCMAAQILFHLFKDLIFGDN